MAGKEKSLIDRSPEMLVAAYYLSRCGSPDLPRSTLPPAALGIQAWNAAYDAVYYCRLSRFELGTPVGGFRPRTPTHCAA